ncbi:MAG: cold-shock protein [Micrococcales bacterium]
MPTGKVRFFDEEKGYGFIESDEGSQVFLHVSALPDGAQTIRKGARVDFSMIDGKKGPQAMAVRLLEPVQTLSQRKRMPSDDLAAILGDVQVVLEALRGGRYPEKAQGKKLAAVLRRVADELDV